MKLIKQVTLYFQEGNSDKVYEVDLCQVEENRYVVNFRYGRREGTLKDGTKTVLPVPLKEAEALFENLLSEKRKKGYRESLQSAPPTPSATRAPENRNAYILSRLSLYAEEIAAGTYSDYKDGVQRWPFSRVVWKAGELKLSEAAELIVPCIGKGTVMLDYCIAWTLGRIGGMAAQQALMKLYNTPETDPKVKRIAEEAMVKLMSPLQREEYRQKISATLPDALREAKEGVALLSALKNYLNIDQYQSFDVLYTLYRIDTPLLRAALIQYLTTAELKPPGFRYIRFIFKAAEYREDGEIFGLLAYRFAKTRAMWNSNQSYIPDYKGKYYYKRNLVKGSDKPSFAYSSNTRTYLRKRVIRTLKTLGENGEASFVKLAAWVLSPYTDSDGGTPRTVEKTRWRWDRTTRRSISQKTVKRYDSFANCLIFNFLLYKNSPRYRLKNKTYQLNEGYKAGDPPPLQREEAFPALWDQGYREILPLLRRSRNLRVHQFGTKVLREQKDFMTSPEKQDIIILLTSPYQVSGELGFNLVNIYLKGHEPDGELISALLQSCLQEARVLGCRLLENRSILVTTELLLEMIFSVYEEPRRYARTFLASHPPEGSKGEALFGALFSRIVLINKIDKPQKEVLSDITLLLLTSFKKFCASLSESILLDLIRHNQEELQALGGQIILIHKSFAEDPPDEVIRMLLKSKFPSVMGLGVELFGKLSDNAILRREKTLKELLFHQEPEVQKLARPILRRLILINDEFKQNFFTELVINLFRLKDEEKIALTVRVLKEDFGEAHHLPLMIIRRMIRSSETKIQELGGWFLTHSEEVDTLSVIDILELSSREALNVRELAWELCRKNPERMRRHMEATVKLLDCRWEDTREFALSFIKEHYKKEDFTPLSLVNICDSNLPEVQQFGKNLIMQYFEARDGAEYLVKLSEHPATTIQFFVTNLLAQYASGYADRILMLNDFMRRVLLSVNKAQTAKERILSFIEEEVRDSLVSAASLAPLLADLTETIAITYRERAIKILTYISTNYPEIALPLSIKEPEVRHAI